MTREKAIDCANYSARTLHEPILVVHDPSAAPDTWKPENCYFTARPDELDCYYLGAQVIYSTEG